MTTETYLNFILNRILSHLILLYFNVLIHSKIQDLFPNAKKWFPRFWVLFEIVFESSRRLRDFVRVRHESTTAANQLFYPSKFIFSAFVEKKQTYDVEFFIEHEC